MWPSAGLKDCTHETDFPNISDVWCGHLWAEDSRASKKFTIFSATQYAIFLKKAALSVWITEWRQHTAVHSWPTMNIKCEQDTILHQLNLLNGWAGKFKSYAYNGQNLVKDWLWSGERCQGWLPSHGFYNWIAAVKSWSPCLCGSEWQNRLTKQRFRQWGTWHHPYLFHMRLEWCF